LRASCRGASHLFHTRDGRLWLYYKTWTQARFIQMPNPKSGIDAVRLEVSAK
jgi:beta-xylosidase